MAALVLLAGCQKKEQAPAPAPAKPAGPAIISAEKNSFAEVTSKLDPGGNLYLYLGTEQVLSGLSNRLSAASNFLSALPDIPGTGRQTLDTVFAVLGGVVKDSGIGQISGLGMSSIAREPGFYFSKVIVHHYPGQNAGLVWSLFGKSPHPLKQLDLLPENTALAAAFDFDLPLAWTHIQQTAQALNIPDIASALDKLPAQFRQRTGLDWDATLLSLGGEYGLILTLDPHKNITVPIGDKPLDIPNPGLCFVFKVNSDLVFNRVDQALEDNPLLGKLLTKVDEPGLKMRTVAVPIPLPVDVRPSLARMGDYLLLASSDTVVREIVAVKSGQKKGYKTTDEFKRLSQGVPDDGNNFCLAAASFGGAVAQIQEKTMANENMDPAALKSLRQLLQRATNAASYSVGANGPDGWEAIANGSQSLQMAVVPAAFVAGAVAAIAIPNFVKARATSQKNACINNLRLLDAAKQQWALEHGAQSGDTPTMKDLQPYFGRGSNGKLPVCPDGGDYTIGPVGEKPACGISGHVLP